MEWGAPETLPPPLLVIPLIRYTLTLFVSLPCNYTVFHYGLYVLLALGIAYQYLLM